MPILPLALPPGSDQGRQPHAGIATTINCEAEKFGTQQRSEMQIWAAPGLDRLATIPGSGGVRAMLEFEGALLAVVGRTLVRIVANGTVTVLGGIPSDGYVGMARNQRGTGAQVIIVCDGFAWIWTQVGGLVRVTDEDIGRPIDVCVVNRSAVYAQADGTMRRSEIDEGSVLSGLDVATAESAPDGLLRVVDRGGELVAIGENSFETWQDIGGDLFGFVRTASVRVGAVGARAITKVSIVGSGLVTDSVAWAATDETGKYAGIVMLEGSTARKIGNPWVDQRFEAVADKSAIVATRWVARGNGYLAFRLPTTTLVYNTSTGVWHERQSRTTAGLPTTWRVGYCATLAGRTLAGDHDLPRVYWLDDNTHDEDGGEMVVTVRTPVMSAFPGRVEINELRLDMVPGVGLATGATPDTDPEVMMRHSRDGETWSHSLACRLGRQAQRERRIKWHRVGTIPAGTFEFSCSGRVARGFVKASWDGKAVDS